MNDEKAKMIGEVIKSKRILMGYSYRQLSDLTGISPSTLQRYEHAYTKDIPIDKFKKSQRFLN